MELAEFLWRNLCFLNFFFSVSISFVLSVFALFYLRVLCLTCVQIVTSKSCMIPKTTKNQQQNWLSNDSPSCFYYCSNKQRKARKRQHLQLIGKPMALTIVGLDSFLGNMWSMQQIWTEKLFKSYKCWRMETQTINRNPIGTKECVELRWLEM